MHYALTVIITAALSLAFTWLVRQVAPRYGLISKPRQDRWHTRPTALMGGVAIYLAFMAGFLLFGHEIKRTGVLVIAASFVFLIGVIDDLIQVKPYIKLVMQIIASSLVIYNGMHLPWLDFEPANYLITLVWLVGISNAINLLDNMDGLAGGIALIACIFLAISFLISGPADLAFIPLVMAGAVAGFLIFNFYPASIFMGDSGSLFLGFSLGSMALLSEWGRTRNIMAVLFTPVLILLIPIFDTTLVTITRKLSGRSVSQGGRDHTSHRMVALGISERRAVLWFYLFAIISGALALLLRQMGIGVTIMVVVGLALTVLFLGIHLGKVKIKEHEDAAANGHQISILSGYPFRRRFLEVLLDTVLIMVAYYGAYLLRFEDNLPPDQLAILFRTLPLVLAIEIFVFLAGGVYRGIWRYVGIDDAVIIGKSVFMGSMLSGMTILFIYRFSGPSRSVIILNGILLLVLMLGTRTSFRLLNALLVGNHKEHPGARPIVIYGAGDGGAMLIGELLNNPDLLYQPVGFIDDDAEKRGKLIRGYQIFGREDLPDLIVEHGVTEILISSLKVPQNRIDDLRTLGVALKRMRIQID